MTKSDFVDWIQYNLDERGWKRVELTRIGGINSGYVSQVMNREKLPGIDFCKGIARAFDMRDIDVLKIAGLIEDVEPRQYSPAVESAAQRERDEARVRRGMLLSAQREVERAETGQGRVLEQVRQWRGLIGQADFEFKRDVLEALDVRVTLRADEAGRRVVEVGTALSLPKPFEYMTARAYQKMLWGGETLKFLIPY